MRGDFNGFILAAGFGSRLKELTATTPKCLVQIGSKTMLERVIEEFQRVGTTSIVVNIHHLPDMVREEMKRHPAVLLSEEVTLLDTGGGVKKGSQLFDRQRPLLIQNSDILTDADLRLLIEEVDSCDVALYVQKKPQPRVFVSSNDMQLLGMRKITELQHPLKEEKWSFCGIQAFSEKAVQAIQEFPDDKFSLVDFYMSLIKSSFQIKMVPITGNYWFDIGTPEQLEIARNYLG